MHSDEEEEEEEELWTRNASAKNSICRQIV